MGLMRLFFASLFITQLSGVIGSRRSDSSNIHKDQLRGNVRGENRNINEEGRISEVNAIRKDQTNMAEIKRNLEKVTTDDYSQMMTWEDDQGFGASNGYDDYYALPEDLGYTGNTADDYYFAEPADDNYFESQNSGTNMGYNQEAISISQSNNEMYYEEDDYFTTDGSGGDDKYYVRADDVNYYNKGGKNGKAEHYNKVYYHGDKGGKSGKSGKYVKHAKSYRDDNYHYGKSGKGHTGYNKDDKDSKVSKGVYHYEYADYDDHTEMDDVFHFQEVDVNHYNTPSVRDQEPWSTDHDDFFVSSSISNTRRRQGGGYQQGRTSTEGTEGTEMFYNDDDDNYFHEDKTVVFLPRPVVTIGGNFFSENPINFVNPVIPDNSQNSLTLGTEYLWDQTLADGQNINSNLIQISVDNEIVNFYFQIDGYCIRIGPADQNSVQGYCFFTYTGIDPTTNVVSGSFTAQGIIINADVPGQLTVSGGTGIMTGAIGLVEILPAALDVNFFPPLLIQPNLGADPFNDVDGWAHFFEITVDILFFLPELYAPPRPSRS